MIRFPIMTCFRTFKISTFILYNCKRNKTRENNFSDNDAIFPLYDVITQKKHKTGRG